MQSFQVSHRGHLTGSSSPSPTSFCGWRLGSVIDERMEGEVRITVVATGFTSTPSSSLESEEGGFSLGALKEEISFGSPLRDMDLEPAIFRRKHSSSERNF